MFGTGVVVNYPCQDGTYAVARINQVRPLAEACLLDIIDIIKEKGKSKYEQIYPEISQ